MSLLKGITEFVDELKAEQIPFGIIGGLAVFAYGGERTTFDVDFLIHGQNREPIKKVAKNLNLKTVNENSEIIQFSGAAQIDVVFANRSKSQAMLKQLRFIGNFPFPVVSPEDLIGLKIQAFVGDRSREFIDKGDILTIMKNVPNLEFDRIKEYADIFNVWNEIEDIKRRL